MWHYRFGHINSTTLNRMVKNKLCIALPLYLNPIELCEGCILGKSSHKSHPRSQSKSTQLNQLVHSNLCGPMETSSLTGSYYFLTFIDDFGRYTTIYFLKKKSEVFTFFKEYCNLVIRQHDLPVQVLHYDNGGEYGSSEFQTFCKDDGIHQQFTIPYTPQQNGVSERKNRTLVEAARAMLLRRGSPRTIGKRRWRRHAMSKTEFHTLPTPTPHHTSIGLVSPLMFNTFGFLDVQHTR